MHSFVCVILCSIVATVTDLFTSIHLSHSGMSKNIGENMLCIENKNRYIDRDAGRQKSALYKLRMTTNCRVAIKVPFTYKTKRNRVIIFLSATIISNNALMLHVATHFGSSLSLYWFHGSMLSF